MRNRQDICAEPQTSFAVVTCAVLSLSAFYSLVYVVLTTLGMHYPRHTLGCDCSYSETFVQTVFTVVICAVLGLSVFYSQVLMCSLIFPQLWLLRHSVEYILHLHPKLER